MSHLGLFGIIIFSLSQFRPPCLTLCFFFDLTHTATVNSEGQTSFIKISFDTRALLAEMVERASRVVATVVEVANNKLCIPEPISKPTRGDSYLVMPPPPPLSKRRPIQPKKRPQNPLELLSDAAADLRIVSPDLKAMASKSNFVPPLTLELPSLDQESQDVSQMTADECANIVDGVLDAFDGDSFTMGPPKKRPKCEP